MATDTAGAPLDLAPESELVSEIRVRLPEHSLTHDLRAVNIVWKRELIRFRTDRLRAITSLIQPFLFLFVLGTGLSTFARRGMPPGVNFKTFIYPGVLAMSVLFTSVFSAGSIVWDREFGFLREMLVAPVRRALARDRQVPRRGHDRHFPGHRVPRPGLVRPRPLQPGAAADALSESCCCCPSPSPPSA